MTTKLKISKENNQYNDVTSITSDILSYLKSEEDNRFKLIITSPPYNIGKSYEEKESIETYLANHDLIIGELVRVLDDGGSICWQVGNYIHNGEVFPLDIYFYQIFKKFGLKLRNRIIWTFGHGLHATKRFSGRYETILWFTKGDNYTFNLDNVRVPSKYPGKKSYKGANKGKPSGNPKGKNPADIWQVVSDDWDSLVWNIPNVKSNHVEKTEHPCQFPVELVERCILALTDEGDHVLDPFGGVGSTIIAAVKNKRKVVSVDKEEIYSEIALDRLQMYLDNELKIREIGTPIYEPKSSDKNAQIPEEWKVKNNNEDR